MQNSIYNRITSSDCATAQLSVCYVTSTNAKKKNDDVVDIANALNYSTKYGHWC